MVFLEDQWVIFTALPLLLCSIVALALIIERVGFVLTRKMLSTKQQTKLMTDIQAGQLDKAREMIEQLKPFYWGAFSEMLTHHDKPKAFREDVVTISLNSRSRQLRKRLTAIVTIAALAPMLGLLGTIIGLMRSFHDIGLSDGPVEPAMVADGLWQALTTTAAGMVIAVICVFFNAFLRAKIRHYVNEVSELLSRISLCFEAKNQTKE